MCVLILGPHIRLSFTGPLVLWLRTSGLKKSLIRGNKIKVKHFNFENTHLYLNS